MGENSTGLNSGLQGARSRRAYVETPEGQLHYRRTGAGVGLPLVLLHQSPTSSAMWEPLLPELRSRGVDAIALDLPGMGMSDPPPAPPSLADYARTVAHGIRALGLDRVDVFGHHTGASVGLQLAVAEPGLVRRLAAYGVALLDEKFARELAEAPPPVFERDARAQLEWWGALWDAAPGNEATVVPRTIGDLLLMGWRASWPHNAVGRADHAALVRAARLPMLFLAGTNEMLRTQTQEAAALTAWAHYVELDGTGGWVADEAPSLLAETVLEFLRRPDEAVAPARAGTVA